MKAMMMNTRASPKEVSQRAPRLPGLCQESETLEKTPPFQECNQRILDEENVVDVELTKKI